MGITVSGFYLKHAVAEFQYGDIECTATKVKYSDLLIVLAFVQAISQGCGRRLVHNPANRQPSDFTGFFGSLALGIIEVGRNGDHRFRYLMTEVIFSRFFHFLKHHGADLLGSVQPAIYVNTNGIIVTFYHLIAPVADLFGYLVKTTAHKSLYRSDGIVGVGNGLALGRVTHLTFTVFQKSHYRRGGTASLVIGYHHRFAAFHNGHAAVGGP